MLRRRRLWSACLLSNAVGDLPAQLAELGWTYYPTTVNLFRHYYGGDALGALVGGIIGDVPDAGTPLFFL